MACPSPQPPVGASQHFHPVALDDGVGQQRRRHLGHARLGGGTIVAIELGFLLAYRAGWKISTAVVTANILVAIALLAVGALAFREPVTPVRLAGIVTCLAGLWLVARG